MPLEPDIARADLVGKRVAVLRRAMANDVGDEDLAAVEADPREQLVQQLAGRADERTALHILVVSGRLAKEEHPRLATPLARDSLARTAVEGAGHARAYLGGQPTERVVHPSVIIARHHAFVGAFRAR